MTLRQSILKNLAASTRYTVLEISMIDFARMTADREPLAPEVVAELVEMEQRGEVVRGRMGAQRIWKLTAKGKRAADSELSTHAKPMAVPDGRKCRDTTSGSTPAVPAIKPAKASGATFVYTARNSERWIR